MSHFSSKQWIVAYLVAFAVMGALDAMWLGLVAFDFYREQMGSLLASPVRVVPAVLFYVLYSLGIVALGVGNGPQSIAGAALKSALVGAVAYGTYDLTNLSTLAGWTLSLSVVDTAWGTFASGVSGAASYAASQYAASQAASSTLTRRHPR